MKTKKASFSLVFYISRTKVRKNGEVPVYLKINLDGAKTSFQIKRHVQPDLWDTNRGNMIGRSAEVKAFNDYLDTITVRAHNMYNQLLKVHDHVTAFQLRDAILGTNSAQPRQVIEIWDEYIDVQSKLIGLEISKITVHRYKVSKEVFREFLQKYYKTNNISIKDVDYRMVTLFSNYLKTEKKCSYNTSMKVLQRLKKITNEALKSGYITKSPFDGLSLNLKDVVRPYLTEDELERIVKYEPAVDRIAKVKDFFLFSCFTGLAYADLKKLVGKEIVKIDDEYWIKTYRQKTNVMANIPLLPVAVAILKKYSVIEDLQDKDPVFPIQSNQKLNAYLKEIADMTGITKTLSFHIARHTFATTVTMMNGVSMESVSKMLGHKDIKSTQRYARIVDRRVGDDMKVLKTKLASNSIYAT